MAKANVRRLTAAPGADKNQPPPPPSVSDDEIIRILQNSVYPGASEGSVRLVLGYCRLNNLDPLLKPVHIVPMSIEVEIENPSYREGTASPRTVKIWRKIDTIMPGIGLYRIRAARAGDYMGLSKPVFGDMIEANLGGHVMSFPEWCEITAYKMINGEKVGFTSVEFWLENYATAGANTEAPNRMWRKRPIAQLVKCTKAQALREGWPDVVGAAPTAEEMEGRHLYQDEVGAQAPIDVSHAESYGGPAQPEPIRDPQPKTPQTEPAALPEAQQAVGMTVEQVTQATGKKRERAASDAIHPNRQPSPRERAKQAEVDREFAHYEEGGKGAWVADEVEREERAAIEAEGKEVAQPAADNQDDAAPLASPGAIKTIKVMMEKKALGLTDLRKVEGFEDLETLGQLRADEVNAVLRWIKNPTGGGDNAA